MRSRSLSMTFGRPASIPEAYCRLELPEAINFVHPSTYQPEEVQDNYGSTDFFRATMLVVPFLLRNSCWHTSNKKYI